MCLFFPRPGLRSPLAAHSHSYGNHTSVSTFGGQVYDGQDAMGFGWGSLNRCTLFGRAGRKEGAKIPSPFRDRAVEKSGLWPWLMK